MQGVFTFKKRIKNKNESFGFLFRQHHLNKFLQTNHGLTHHTTSSKLARTWFLIQKYLSVCVWVGFHVGTSVTQVTATDADDANYGNSAKVVYSILQGQPYFSVDPESGTGISPDLFLII